MRSTPFITTPYTIDEIIDEYVFYLIEQGTNKVYALNGLTVFDPDYRVIGRLRKASELLVVSSKSEPVESLNSRGMNEA